MIGRTNAGTGGGSGATLVITGVAGDICTITKDGKSKTKTFAADGTATFKGLATGTWSVTMSNPGGDIVTQPVAINADYSLTIAYFAATIAITYPAGSTCTCSKDSTTFTAPDTSGSWTCTVPSTGTWTVSCTNGEKTKSADVSITADGDSESVALLYEMVVYEAGSIKVGNWENSIYSDGTVSWDAGGVNLKSRPNSTATSTTPWQDYCSTYSAPVDLTDFNTMKVTVSDCGSNQQYSGFWNSWVGLTSGRPSATIITNQTPNNPTNAIVGGNAQSAGTYSFDITSISAAHVCLWCACGYGQTTQAWLTVTKVSFE